ncbi:MAG: WG repeat-containing protein [Armatimonadota bacterium]
MLDIFNELLHMEQQIGSREWNRFEETYRASCAVAAGEEHAVRIASVDLTDYSHELSAALRKAVESGIRKKAKALYFEYDLDNDWQSAFFVCKRYLPRKREDDEWACDWSEDIPGPAQPALGSIYAEHDFGGSDFAVASTLYLIARTIAALGRCVDEFRAKTNLQGMAICIGFHDQADVFRLLERGDDPTALYTPPFVERRLPDLAEPEQRFITLIPPKYDNLGGFQDGLAPATLACASGFIDMEDRLVIPFQFEQARGFDNGLAAVMVDGHWGFIDRSGEVVIPPKYDDIWPFQDGIAMVRIGGEYGFLDAQGIYSAFGSYEEIGVWREGLLAVRLRGLWGFIDHTGQMVIEPKYLAASSYAGDYPMFSEGLAAVKEQSTIGYINTAGEMVMATPEDWLKDSFGSHIGEFRDGCALIAWAPNYCSYYNAAGEEIASGVIGSPFSEGLAQLLLRNGKTVFIDTQGNIVFTLGKRKFHGSEGQAQVELSSPCGEFQEGLASVFVKPHNRWGFIDRNGELVLRFDYLATKFHHGVASISAGSRYGYINRNGHLLLSPLFDYAFDFGDGQGIIRLNDKHGIVVDPTFIR